jgi:hypothetical protein
MGRPLAEPLNFTVIVDSDGFDPAHLTVRPGQPRDGDLVLD